VFQEPNDLSDWKDRGVWRSGAFWAVGGFGRSRVLRIAVYGRFFWWILSIFRLTQAGESAKLPCSKGAPEGGSGRSLA